MSMNMLILYAASISAMTALHITNRYTADLSACLAVICFGWASMTLLLGWLG